MTSLSNASRSDNWRNSEPTNTSQVPDLERSFEIYFEELKRQFMVTSGIKFDQHQLGSASQTPALRHEYLKQRNAAVKAAGRKFDLSKSEHRIAYYRRYIGQLTEGSSSTLLDFITNSDNKPVRHD